jgi:hypothetical protein
MASVSFFGGRSGGGRPRGEIVGGVENQGHSGESPFQQPVTGGEHGRGFLTVELEIGVAASEVGLAGKAKLFKKNRPAELGDDFLLDVLFLRSVSLEQAAESVLGSVHQLMGPRRRVLNG